MLQLAAQIDDGEDVNFDEVLEPHDINSLMKVCGMHVLAIYNNYNNASIVLLLFVARSIVPSCVVPRTPCYQCEHS